MNVLEYVKLLLLLFIWKCNLVKFDALFNTIYKSTNSFMKLSMLLKFNNARIASISKHHKTNSPIWFSLATSVKRVVRRVER